MRFIAKPSFLLVIICSRSGRHLSPSSFAVCADLLGLPLSEASVGTGLPTELPAGYVLLTAGRCALIDLHISTKMSR